MPDVRLSRTLTAFTLAAVLAGCGARSELVTPDVDDSADAGSDTSGERSCLPNCSIGHLCCQGGCEGPAVPLESDCCVCLPGEVSSADCPGSECADEP